jgi:hypothetical protein
MHCSSSIACSSLDQVMMHHMLYVLHSAPCIAGHVMLIYTGFQRADSCIWNW